MGKAAVSPLTLRMSEEELKPVRAAEVLETVVSRSEESQASYLAFLDHLLEEEVAAREKRRIQTALKIAGLPFGKTIEEYDFLFHPHLDKKAVMEPLDLFVIYNPKTSRKTRASFSVFIILIGYAQQEIGNETRPAEGKKHE
jgi:DNA replication protein DnaC